MRTGFRTRHAVFALVAIGLLAFSVASMAATTNNGSTATRKAADGMATQGAPIWQVNSLLSCGCASDDIGFNIFESISASDTVHTVVTVNGVVYMDELVSGWYGTAYTDWHLYYANEGGTATGTWPLPSGYPVYVNITVENPVGTVLAYTKLVLDSCNSCTIVSNEHSPGTPVPATGHLGLIVLAALLLIAGVFVILRLRA